MKSPRAVFILAEKASNILPTYYASVLRKILGEKNHMIVVMSLFSKSFVFTFSVQPTFVNAKPVYSNSSDLKSVFEKLRFLDGLVWTIDLTVVTKLRFHISQAQCELGLRISPLRGKQNIDRELNNVTWSFPACFLATLRFSRIMSNVT